MDYTLRCNDLKCRTELHDRAVVTSCCHVLCAQCADSTGFSQANSANRVCPACNTPLPSHDDVVVADLNPSEEYRATILAGLSPAAIMECASKGLAFWSYQATQEILYQDQLAKSLTEKYTSLNQQMDQLINDANAQIKILQDKIHSLQEERADLEKKNNELGEAFREKSHSQQKIQRMYQQLKAQVMATHVADAAGDEADLTIHTARGDRFVNRIPGARSGAANLSQLGANQNVGGRRRHNRDGSGSSGSNEQQRGSMGGIGLGPQFGSNLQARGFGGRVNSGHSAPVGTPSQSQGHRSRLPVLGGQRPNSFLNVDVGSNYHQASPMARQPLGGGLGPRNMGNFGFGGQSKRRGLNNIGPLGR
ncbi:hypothetical protein CC80DRAFT_445752 [Byssothecium circinans]|uniref:RING-type domain-containing protein n=1 Tax=Byssothecium circinans TaxID=147558 RepID=A0A6A5TU20_9PLEO|nr:hypothetical protein CC80DRAFT_445752 [Byssothecium circinans]